MIALALGLQAGVFLVLAAIFASRRGASLLHPLAFYLAFHALVFVIRPTLVHALDFDQQFRLMRYQPTPAEFVLTLTVASLGLLVFAVVLLPQRPVPAPRTPPGLHFDRTQRQAFWLTLGLLLPWALYGARQDMAIFGTFAGRGEAGMIIDPETAQSYFTGTTGYIVKAHNLLVPIAALFAAVYRFRIWALLPLAGVVAFRAYLGSRWGMVIAVAILLLLCLHHRGMRWPPAGVALAALPLLAAFHLVGENRDALREALGVGPLRYEAVQPRTESGLDKLDTPSFANFDFLAYIVAVVPERSNTHSHFTQHLEIFTRPVPRMFWPDKPRGPPIKLVDLNDHGWFGTRTRSLVGDGWISAGWPGVVLTCGAVAWVLGRLYVWYQRRADSLFPALVYACFLPVTLMWFRGGNIVSAARYGFWMLLPVLVWWSLARVLAATRARAAARRAPT